MMAQPIETNTLIIGAGAAGLAVGACLQKAGVPFIILEQAAQVGSVWRTHYDRLHLHTDKSNSKLPYWPIPKHFPKYLSRDQVVVYLEGYANHFQLQPRWRQRVLSAIKQTEGWQVQTDDHVYHSENLVVATGYTRRPFLPTWPGQESFAGQIFHSAEYKNGRPFQDKNVLIVGFGNSGCEIAIDLCEHGANTAMSVRNPVNVIPRDLLGIPILTIGILLSIFPPRLADALSAPIVRLAIGDLTQYGLRKQPYGSITQITQDKQIPLLDIGTVKLIKQGKIHIHPGIEQLTTDGAHFINGTQARFDAIILATGYRPQVNDFLHAPTVFDDNGTPHASGQESQIAGLYFCGFYVSPTGMLREIAQEAMQISWQIVSQMK
jgi:cation diffusion facilitator CzcD-associated flavoprotein CzcO